MSVNLKIGTDEPSSKAGKRDTDAESGCVARGERSGWEELRE